MNINDKSEVVSFKEAVFKSISNEQGLYMPEYIPKLPKSFFEMLPFLNCFEIAYFVDLHMFEGGIPDKDLERIVKRSINFDFPLIQLSKKIAVLELFHGPTLAFKDVGARFMAEIIFFLKDEIGIFLKTAHPVKFHRVVEQIIESKIEFPIQLLELKYKQKKGI